MSPCCCTGFGGKRPFNYFTFGAALTEVELDTLTGNWHILRADMVMDVGQSLNPAIDIGQVEGGYVQGEIQGPCSCSTLTMNYASSHSRLRS